MRGGGGELIGWFLYGLPIFFEKTIVLLPYNWRALRTDAAEVASDDGQYPATGGRSSRPVVCCISIWNCWLGPGARCEYADARHARTRLQRTLAVSYSCSTFAPRNMHRSTLNTHHLISHHLTTFSHKHSDPIRFNVHQSIPLYSSYSSLLASPSSYSISHRTLRVPRVVYSYTYSTG